MSNATSGSGFSWGRLVRLFGPHRARVAVVVVLGLVTAVAGIINPLLIRKVFDDALFAPGGPYLSLLWTLTVVMIGVAVVTGVLGVVQTVITSSRQARKAIGSGPRERARGDESSQRKPARFRSFGMAIPM